MCTQPAVNAAKSQNHTYKHSFGHTTAMEMLKCQSLLGVTRKESISVIFITSICSSECCWQMHLTENEKIMWTRELTRGI